jgi:hypothetical protein
MKRGAPLKRSPLKRKTPLRPRNPQRRAKMYARNYGEHADFLRGLCCSVPDCRLFPLQVAHTVTRKRGSVGGTWRDTCPLCLKHHPRQEGRTAEFSREIGVDLIALADALVCADPGAPLEEIVAAWGRLDQRAPGARSGALQRTFEMTGTHPQRPRV